MCYLLFFIFFNSPILRVRWKFNYRRNVVLRYKRSKNTAVGINIILRSKGKLVEIKSCFRNYPKLCFVLNEYNNSGFTAKLNHMTIFQLKSLSSKAGKCNG